MNETTTVGNSGANEASAARRAQWAANMEGQARSGKTITAYCTEQELKVWQFHYWRGALQPKTARTQNGTPSLFIMLRDS